MGEIKQNLKIIGLKGIMRVDAIFDSGATMSYIKQSIAEKIGLKDLGKVTYEMPNGKEEEGYMSSMIVVIRNRSAPTQIIISPTLKDDLILGQNFLQYNDIILNFKKDKFRFGEHQPKVRRIYKI